MITVLVFLSGFLLSATAAYYSIIGLVAIFPASQFAIISMGSTLELSKLVAASWLYRNWSIAPYVIKIYMIVSIIILMVITSMGIFGFLSKAHLESTLLDSNDAEIRITNLDLQIDSRKRTSETLQRQINAIDSSLERYIEEGAVSRGLQQRATLSKDRKALEDERKTVENEILELSAEKNQLSIDIKKKEVEVGPLKYIAELIYGENAENYFDSAVRLVIILLIIVFDPLAVVLLIAGNVTLKHKNNDNIKVVGVRKKYVKRKKNDDQVYEFKEENYGIQHVDEKEEK